MDKFDVNRHISDTFFEMTALTSARSKYIVNHAFFPESGYLYLSHQSPVDRRNRAVICITGIYEPGSASAVYQNIYPVYQDLYPVLRPSFSAIALA
jgi:hypothetical protein